MLKFPRSCSLDPRAAAGVRKARRGRPHLPARAALFVRTPVDGPSVTDGRGDSVTVRESVSFKKFFPLPSLLGFVGNGQGTPLTLALVAAMGKLRQIENLEPTEAVEEQQLLFGGEAAYGSANDKLDSIAMNIETIKAGKAPGDTTHRYRALPCALVLLLLMCYGGFFGVMLVWDTWTPERGIPALLIVLGCFSGMGFLGWLYTHDGIEFGDEGWMVESEPDDEDTSKLSRKELLARNYAHRFDNVKFIMTQFVAQHHFTLLYDVVYNAVLPRLFGYWVEWFLMPTYCFMSGTLTSVQQTPARSQAVFSKLLACYIVAQTIFYLLFKVVINDWIKPYEDSNYSIYSMTGMSVDTGAISQFALPMFHLWYLTCLVFWRLIGPHWMQFKYPIALSIVVGVLSGFFQKFYVKNIGDFTYLGLFKYGIMLQQTDDVMMQEPFCLHRMMGFFPYYIIGMVLKDRGLIGGKEGGWVHKVMSHPWCRYVAGVNSVIMLGLAYYAINCKPEDWTCTGSAYFAIDEVMVNREIIRNGESLSVDAPNIWSCILGGFGRICIYMGCTSQVLLTFCLFPNYEVIFNIGAHDINISDKGKRSLVNYIFHAAVFFLLIAFNYYTAERSTGAWMWFTVFMCFGVCQFLLSTWGSMVFGKLTAPPMDSWFAGK